MKRLFARKPQHDQADRLRDLVREKASSQKKPTDRRGVAMTGPPLIVLAGAKGGVGVTTLTLKLAKRLGSQGRAVLAVDGNTRQTGLAELAGVEAGGVTTREVLAGKARAVDALAPAGSGVWVMPGARVTPDRPEPGADHGAGVVRVAAHLRGVVEVVLLDAGSGLSPFAAPLWQAASETLLVTTPERLSLLGAYASLKLASRLDPRPRVTLLPNRVRSLSDATRIHATVGGACQQFLGHGATAAGFVGEGLYEDHTVALADRIAERLLPSRSPDRAAA